MFSTAIVAARVPEAGKFSSPGWLPGIRASVACDAAWTSSSLRTCVPFCSTLAIGDIARYSWKPAFSEGKFISELMRSTWARTGLTFYDDEVIKFFSPHAEGKSAIFWSLL